MSVNCICYFGNTSTFEISLRFKFKQIFKSSTLNLNLLLFESYSYYKTKKPLNRISNEVRIFINKNLNT